MKRRTILVFADESLPVNDIMVDKKMKHTLMLHGYKKIQSNLLQQKAQKLFPIIEPILKAYGIPDDFKYIPLVESGLSEGDIIQKEPQGYGSLCPVQHAPTA